MNAKPYWDKRIISARREMVRTFSNGMGPLTQGDPRLVAAIKHVLSKPGSMTRAVIAYLIGIEMGLVDELARHLACGIEYLHTASLIFDDMPAMDDARMRRGVPCVHLAYGEGIGVLAALALINRGYSMIWDSFRGAPPVRSQMAAQMLEKRLGVNGVIGGQAYDLCGNADQLSSVEVTEVAARKTGDMLRLTLALPAVVGGATSREIQLLDKIGLMRGLAYQVADDLKDVMVDHQSGKTAGRDEAMGRPNLILSEGFQSALTRFKRLRRVGDRLQAALPGPPRRWGMLMPLRVTLPDVPVVDLKLEAGEHQGDLPYDAAVGS